MGFGGVIIGGVIGGLVSNFLIIQGMDCSVPMACGYYLIGGIVVGAIMGGLVSGK